MENIINNINSISDMGFLALIGDFIKNSRLSQNKTQQQVADSAGINRSTLQQIERGKGGTVLLLLQVLRVLDQLQVLRLFQVEQKVSPLQLAKLEQQQRRRARNNNGSAGPSTIDW